MSTPHRLPFDLHKMETLVDPGTGGTILLGGRSHITVVMTSVGASETRTLPAPSKEGLQVTLVHGVDGGDIDLTVTSGFDAGGDTTMNTATAGDFVTFIAIQTAADTFRWRILAFEGFTGAGNTVTLSTPVAAQQTLAAGGTTVTITEYYTAGASDVGGDAWTLINGVTAGQLKKIQLVTDGGGNAVLTPTTLTGGTTITFADVGDYCVLCWDGSSWVAIELGNDADGATAPVLA